MKQKFKEFHCARRKLLGNKKLYIYGQITCGNPSEPSIIQFSNRSYKKFVISGLWH